MMIQDTSAAMAGKRKREKESKKRPEIGQQGDFFATHVFATVAKEAKEEILKDLEIPRAVVTLNALAVAPETGFVFAASHGHVLRFRVDDASQVDILAGDVVSGDVDAASNAARFQKIGGLAYDPKRDVLYISDQENNKIKKLSVRSRRVKTIAGDLEAGSTDGNGSDARFRRPRGLTLSHDCSYLYVADIDNHSVRRIDVSRENYVTTTIAGSNDPGNKDNNVGRDARFNGPTDVVADSKSEFLYVADGINDKIRRVDLREGKDFAVSTLAGNFVEGDADGIGADARFNGPWALTLHESVSENFVYVCDRFNHKLRSVDVDSREVRTLYTFSKCSSKKDMFQPTGIVIVPDQNVLLVNASVDSNVLISARKRNTLLRKIRLPTPDLYQPIVVSPSTLSEDMRRTFGDSSLPQGMVTFIVGDEKRRRFEHVSKNILCVRSDYFSRMFRSGMSETVASEIHIRDTNPDAFALFLQFLITDSIDTLKTDGNEAFDLLVLARRYSVDRLEELVMKHIEEGMTAKNVMRQLRWAYKNGDRRLFTKARLFIFMHGEDVKRTGSFAQIDDMRIALGLLNDVVDELGRMRDVAQNESHETAKPPGNPFPRAEDGRAWGHDPGIAHQAFL
eukprot:g494.t1